MRQPTLFEKASDRALDAERVILFALGDFQSRGKVLIDRDLPLDRLRGAFKRAAENFGVSSLADESIVAVLEQMGARVRRVATFFAKHPYRVIVPEELATRAKVFWNEAQKRV